MEPVVSDWKPRPWLAALLSLAPGAGHLYSGHLATAVGIVVLLPVWLFALVVGSCYAPTWWARVGLFGLIFVTRFVILPLWGYAAARDTPAAAKRGFRQWPLLTAYVVLGVIVIPIIARRVALPYTDWYRMVSSSMEPTVEAGDVVVTAIDFDDEPHHGDVVMTTTRSGALVFRRIIGLPGDRVELRNYHALINGQPEQPAEGPCVHNEQDLANNPTARFQLLADYGPVAIPIGEYALFGDCRDNAVDVRHTGFVRRTDFMKRRAWILWSADAQGHVRVNRIGQLVQ